MWFRMMILDPGAYITDGKVLYEVIEADGKKVTLEDCREGDRSRVEIWRVKLPPWRMVKDAPRVPEPSVLAA